MIIRNYPQIRFPVREKLSVEKRTLTPMNPVGICHKQMERLIPTGFPFFIMIGFYQ